MSDRNLEGAIVPQLPGSEPAAHSTAVSDRVQAAGPERPSLEPMWQVIKRLPTYARLSTVIARDRRVPGSAKAMLAAGGLYLVSPIDLVPGFIPVAGQLDDLYVVLTALRQAMRTSPDDVIDEHLNAVGIDRACIDDDLAAIREFVRRGVVWSLHKGGQAVARGARSAIGIARRMRRQEVFANDQKPNQSGTSST